MKNLFKSKKGFTLIEIVIVIAIIGLLMVILIPSAINAFKNNRLQGAKLKAQRVAQAVEAGIGSGKIPLTDTNRERAGIVEDENKKLITECGTVVNVNTVYGLENIYNSPVNNDDLIDPLGEGAVADNIFRIKWNGDAKTEEAPKGQAYIYNSTSAANKMEGGIKVDDLVYSATDLELINPKYYKS